MAISFKHTAQELNRGIVEVQFQRGRRFLKVAAIGIVD